MQHLVSALQADRHLIKVVVPLLGDEDEMVRVWKVGGPGECQVRITKDYLLLHTHIVKRGHFYHVLKSRTPESNVFTPYLRSVHSGVNFGIRSGGGWFACERVMGRSWFSVFEVFSRIPSLRSHVTVVGYGFWKFTPKTGG